PASVLQPRLKGEVLAVLAAHVGVVAIEADRRRVGAVTRDVETAGRPAVLAVDRSASPACFAVSAADAGQLAARGGVLPVGVELEVVAEVNLLRLGADPLAELVAERRARVLAARHRDLQALALASEGLLAVDQGGVDRLFRGAPRPPPVGVLE